MDTLQNRPSILYPASYTVSTMSARKSFAMLGRGPFVAEGSVSLLLSTVIWMNVSSNITVLLVSSLNTVWDGVSGA